MNTKRVMLIRHGKTQGNIERRYIGGGTDESLCDEGIAELKALVQDGIYSAVIPEVVYSSPMKRCVESANIIFAQDIVRIESLREMYFGEFEGMTHAEIIARPGCADFGIDEEHMVFAGGESYKNFAARCVEAFGSLLAAEHKSFALVVHGGVIMAIMQEFFGRDMYDYIATNGKGYLLFLGDEKEWQLI